jgi:hypothetical protein
MGNFAMVTKDEITGEWICHNSCKILQKAESRRAIDRGTHSKEDKQQCGL